MASMQELQNQVVSELEAQMRPQVERRDRISDDRSGDIFQQFQEEMAPLFNQIFAQAGLVGQANAGAFNAGLRRAGLGNTGIGASAPQAFVGGAQFGANTLRARALQDLHQQAIGQDRFERGLAQGAFESERNFSLQQQQLEDSRPGLFDKIFQGATTALTAGFNPVSAIGGLFGGGGGGPIFSPGLTRTNPTIGPLF